MSIEVKGKYGVYLPQKENNKGNWIGLKVDLNEKDLEHVEFLLKRAYGSLINKQDIVFPNDQNKKTVERHHVTLIYDIDPSKLFEVCKLVQEQAFTESDLWIERDEKTGTPFVDFIITKDEKTILPIIRCKSSKRFDDFRSKLFETYLLPHSKYGKHEPHVTACYAALGGAKQIEHFPKTQFIFTWGELQACFL